jgi:hypothetical protein
MALIASEYLDTVKDIVLEGSIQYDGFQAYLLGFGISLNIAGDGYPTGLEAAAVPILSTTLHFNEGRDSATSYTTVLNFSNRRAPYSGRALLRPSITGQPLGFAESNIGSLRGWGESLVGQYGGWKSDESGEMSYSPGALQESMGNTMGQSQGAFSRMHGDATTGAAAQAASAGMGNPVTGMGSPQEAMMGNPQQGMMEATAPQAGPDPMEGFTPHGNRLASTGTTGELFANRKPIVIQPETEEEASERRGRQRKEE